MKKHAWVSKYIEQKSLADTIEEYMAVRGEYDFSFEDRIYCLQTNDRKSNAKFILTEIQNNNVGLLIDYFESDLMFNLCDDDELIPVAQDLLNDLKEL